MYKGMEGLDEETDGSIIPLPDIVSNVLTTERPEKTLWKGEKGKERAEGTRQGS